MPTQTPVHTLSTQPVYDVAIVSLTLTDSKRLTTMLHQVTYDEAYSTIEHWRKTCGSLHTEHVIIHNPTAMVVFDSDNVTATIIAEEYN